MKFVVKITGEWLAPCATERVVAKVEAAPKSHEHSVLCGIEHKISSILLILQINRQALNIQSLDSGAKKSLVCRYISLSGAVQQPNLYAMKPATALTY